MGQLCSSPSEKQEATQTQPQTANQKPAANGTAPSQAQPQSAPAAQPQQQPSKSQPAQSGSAPTFGGAREWPASSSAGDAARFRASEHAQKRGELLSQSQAAWNSGDKAAAKVLSEQGKAEGAAMEKANAEAAELYFNDNNKKHDEGTIDLHGLYVEEAIDRLEQRLTSCQKNGRAQLIIIFGKGNHSKDGVRKIKPAVEKIMAQYKLRVAVDRSDTQTPT